MPIYEFECEQCGARFEELVEAGTESVPCGECGGAMARRYSAQASSFKLVKPPGRRAPAGGAQRRPANADQGRLQAAPQAGSRGSLEASGPDG